MLRRDSAPQLIPASPSLSPPCARRPLSQTARPMVTNNLRRVLLGATESHSVPMPVEMKKAVVNLRQPALQWAAGATESAAIPRAVPKM